jgi:CDGSH-type Zn-finger protein
MSDRPVTIMPYPNGPLIVRGDMQLATADGTTIPARTGAVALCRCGMSAIKPFCDGTHKVTGFRTG